MAVYAIGDLHLPFGRNLSMEVFGPVWKDYTQRLAQNWGRLVSESDTVVVAGDLSWAGDMNEAVADFLWLEKLPGKKLLVKGNHDHYWCSVSRMRRILAENGVASVDFIHNSSVYADGLSLCGTRGWFLDETGDRKVFERELGRLTRSLEAARDRDRRICFLHYPPVCREFDCCEIRKILEDFGVKHCYYGHLHGNSVSGAFRGTINGVKYDCISADSVGFMPVLIRE